MTTTTNNHVEIVELLNRMRKYVMIAADSHTSVVIINLKVEYCILTLSKNTRAVCIKYLAICTF